MFRLIRRIVRSDHALIVVCGLVVTFLILLLYTINPAFLSFLDHKMYDQLLAQTHTSKISPIPVIVDIDEKSLAEYGQFPWPRYRVALLLAKLAQHGALSVGLDILLAEPDRTSPVVLRQQLKNELMVDVEFSGLPKQLENNDAVLADVLARGPFVLGYYFDFQRMAATTHNASFCKVKPVGAAVKSTVPNAPPLKKILLTAHEAVCPLPMLATAARGAGFYNTTSDEDGIVRSVPLLITWNNKVYPNLALATLMQALGKRTVIVKVTSMGTESMRIGRLVVPLDAHGQMLINYHGGPNTYPYVSAADVLTDRVKPELLKNKIVFIGTSAAGLKDLRATPLGANYPGVEAHATVVDNILSGDYLTRPDWAPGLELLVILTAGVLITVLLTFAKALLILIPLVIMGGALWETSAWCMSSMNIYVSPLYGLLVLMANFVMLTALKFWREEGHKKFLHATFASYLSPELIKNMVDEKTMPELGGEARIITAYFTDIQSFSTFSEKLTAHQLVELLNEYLSAMTDILIADNGTLDKYEGDAIIAFFGAPLDVPDHALRACRTALAMQDALWELRHKWSCEKIDPNEKARNTKDLPPDQWGPEDKWPFIVHNMQMRIGINSGEIVVGNMGSSMRMNYTMMGDSVNLAARLEAGAKQYGVYTMASEYTLGLTFHSDEEENSEGLLVRDMLEARMIDNIQVVGKEEPVRVYELMAMKGGLSARDAELKEVFDKAMATYLAMEWDEALALFSEADKLERFPSNKITPSRVFMERCRQFKENPPVPPGQPWDGVYRMTKK